MRIVSFSLYGSDLKYINGAYENASFISMNMKGWQSLFYLGAEIEDEVMEKLIELGAIVLRQQKDWHCNGMFWRFKVFHDFLPEYAIIRDTDSRISAREIQAISEWVESGKMFHIMRDHPNHNTRILGGMWGGRKELSTIIPFEAQLMKYSNERGQDQVFLSEYLYPKVRKFALVHDSFFWINIHRRKFPTQSFEGEYIGESYGEDNSFDSNLREIRKICLSSFIFKFRLNVLYFKQNSLLLLRLRNILGKTQPISH